MLQERWLLAVRIVGRSVSRGSYAGRIRRIAPAIGMALTLGAGASIALAASPHARARAGATAASHARPNAMAASHARPRSTRHASSPQARAARKLHARDRAKLRYRGAVGEEVYETGRASGNLPGTMRVHMVFASTFRGRFTIYTPGGRIDGHGKAKPHGGGVYESFAGTLTVTGGTGSYRHAHGTAHLYGTFNRDDYALTINTAGTLHF